jgi:hypothetical protein
MRHGDRRVFSVQTRYGVARAGKAVAAQDLAQQEAHRPVAELRAERDLEGGRLFCSSGPRRLAGVAMRLNQQREAAAELSALGGRQEERR